MFRAGEYFLDYLREVQSVAQALHIGVMERILARVIFTIDQEKTIYLFGNGGSMATASHLACDLNYVAGIKKLNKKIKAIALDSLPTLMAIGNDEGFEWVFQKQLLSLLNPGDLVIAFSGSGNSENVLDAVRYAKRSEVFTIGITGFSGGILSDIADLSLIVPIHDMQIVEDFHTIFSHMLMRSLVEYYSQSKEEK